MYTKRITFDDLEGNSVTDEFHFHLSKPQMARLEVSKKGGLDKWVKEIMDNGDSDLILATFEKLISMSYGLKHEDGRQFIQSDALSDAFMQTDAYSQFFEQLLSSAQEAALFITNIVPKDMRDRVPNLETTEVEEKRILDVPVESLSPQLDSVAVHLKAAPVVDPPKPKSALGVVQDEGTDLSNMSEQQLREILAKLQK